MKHLGDFAEFLSWRKQVSPAEIMTKSHFPLKENFQRFFQFIVLLVEESEEAGENPETILHSPFQQGHRYHDPFRTTTVCFLL